jgi:hypothetical protein
MKCVLMVTAIPLLFIGCASHHPIVSSSNVISQINAVAVVVPHSCKTRQDEKRRVFHIMYKDQTTAEKAYLKLSAYSNELQFLQLMNTARLESIDSSTRDRGGDLGYIKFGTFDKSFSTAVFHLPLKTLSHPIQSQFGWHLVWVSSALDINSNVPCE